MAQRRMFSKTVTNSAKFLQMPQSARLLYYDLGMAADDDGVAEAFTVLRMTGAAEEDLAELTKKEFVRILNDELLIAYICDWKINNSIKGDRYKQSVYKDLLDGTKMEPERNQNGTKMEPQARIGKDRQVEDSLGEVIVTLDELKDYCQETGSKIDPEYFFDFYQSRGWMTGESPIKDWKALVRSWEKREANKPKKITTAAEYKAPPAQDPVKIWETVNRI